MRSRSEKLAAVLLLLLLTLFAGAAWAQEEEPGEEEPVPVSPLNENCTVSILNRSAQVAADGSWVIPNVPTNVGMVRARATCIENGVTRVGQSDYFTVPLNGLVQVSDVVFDAPQPIPATVTLTTTQTSLGSVGATAQVTATAVYADATTRDVTFGAGTNYFASNPRVATVEPNGVVTARGTGTVLISALNEGALGMLLFTVITTGDADGDGLPDDFELENGLAPNNPADAALDLDGDGLTNLQEFQNGTNLRNPDTDGDAINDGEEVVAGADGFVTSPLLADTDGDGLRDGLETQTGSDPTNPNSYNLAAALTRIDVTPAASTLIVNTLVGEAYTQLTVIGRLRDNTSLDLTATSRGTTYTSSNLNIVNFGVPEGRVFAGQEGSASVTVANNGHTFVVPITVRNFSPIPLGAVNIPGHANSVDVRGGYAFVASGFSGLMVVDVSNPAAPAVITRADTPGVASDVRISGNYAYVADGSAGLQVVDISNPTAPVVAGSVNISATANDVAVSGSVAYIAAGTAGLVVVNVATPGAPILVHTLRTGGNAKGVDVVGTTVVVVEDGSLKVINAANPASPQIVGSIALPGGTANDVRVSGNIAYVAAYTSGLQLIDIGAPATPRLIGSLPGSAPLGFIPNDVALASQFALAAEVLFVNSVPIVDVGAPTAPVMRGTVNFQSLGDYNGNGITTQGAYVYMTGSTSLTDRQSSGFTRLFVGQFLPLEDRAGNPPQVILTNPPDGVMQIEGDTLRIAADAVDDIAVTAVQFLIDGQVVFTDTSVPYEHTMLVPTGVTSMTIGARAFDLADNIGTAPNVVAPVMPDPLTSVAGVVVDVNGAPVAGATVMTTGDLTAITGSDGSFVIGGVSTIRGPIVVTANASAANGDPLSGSSQSFPAVRGGTTAVGSITVYVAKWETNYGTFITTCDDCSFQRTLPFTFRFYNSQRTIAHVGTNGYITFDSGDSTYTESLPAFSSRPRISAFFDDLIGGGGMWINDQLPGRFVVTYVNNQHYSFGGSNTLQMTLFADGRIQFGYKGITALSSGSITGLTPAPNSPFVQVDFSSQTSFNVPANTAVFEYFTGTNRFDLDGAFILFNPRADGGYDVRTILAPASLNDAQITNGSTAAGVEGRLVSASSNGQGQGRFAKAEVEVVSSRDPHYRATVNTDKDGIFKLKKVPLGGVELTVRRKGEIIGHGAAVITGDAATQTIEITPPSLTNTKDGQPQQ